MEEKLSELRNRWWEAHQANNVQSAIDLDPNTKSEFLKMIYQGLYGELQSIHSSQQQIVGWGFAILSGGGLLISTVGGRISWLVMFLLLATFGALTYVASSTIGFLSEDRMSIARQLDRIHQIVQTFKVDVYARETTLLDPIWYGWGFSTKNDSNWKLARSYQVLLWLIFAVDAALVLNSVA